MESLSSSSSTFSRIEVHKSQEESWESRIEELQNMTQQVHDSVPFPPAMGFASNIHEDSPLFLFGSCKRIWLNWEENEDREEQQRCANEMQREQSAGISGHCSDVKLSEAEDIYCYEETTGCKKQFSSTSSTLSRPPMKRNIPLGTKKCSQCQTRIPAAIATCTCCGYSFRIKKELKKLSSGERGKKLCPNCQVKLPAAMATCPNCNHIFRKRIIMKANK